MELSVKYRRADQLREESHPSFETEENPNHRHVLFAMDNEARLERCLCKHRGDYSQIAGR